MTRRQPSGDPLFNDRGELSGRWHLTIARRLDAGGCADLPSRCRLLAGLIDVDDMAVWAMTMWNTPASADMADKLRGWVQAGMPLCAGRKHPTS